MPFLVHLDYKVKTGEIVEILTSNAQGKGPSRDWLKMCIRDRVNMAPALTSRLKIALIAVHL